MAGTTWLFVVKAEALDKVHEVMGGGNALEEEEYIGFMEELEVVDEDGMNGEAVGTVEVGNVLELAEEALVEKPLNSEYLEVSRMVDVLNLNPDKDVAEFVFLELGEASPKERPGNFES